jgi:hypothetical protein
VVRHQHRRPVADPLAHLIGELLTAREFVVGDGHVAADEHLDLFDRARDRLARECEHRAVLRVTVDHRVDVVVRLQAREVQHLLGRRPRGAFDDVAVEVDDHELVERHRLVGQRGRREHDIAVGESRGEVARGAVHEVGAQALLRDPEQLGLDLVRRPLEFAHNTSGFTQLTGFSPFKIRATSSAMSLEWFASVS